VPANPRARQGELLWRLISSKPTAPAAEQPCAFYVCVIDGVFEALPDAGSAKSVNIQPVTLHPARIDEAVISQVKANVRQRILRAFVARAPAPSVQRATSNEQLPAAMAVASRSTPGCPLRQQTVPDWSAFCVTARAYPSPWTGSSTPRANMTCATSP
jgi:hypothetical protein